MAGITQQWRDVSFLHWRIDPGVIAGHLPRDLTPDLVDGSAWVTLTPFLVKWYRTHPETNLRTYVKHADGTTGLWFLSIDVGDAFNALAGRALAPYFYSDMRVDVGDVVRYSCERKAGRPAVHDITVRPLDQIGPGNRSPTVDSLTNRFHAFSAAAGRTLAVTTVHHEPWPLQFAEVVELNESMLAAVGLPTPTEQPLAQFSRGVTARLTLGRR
jgi:uncharacterized protein YqjF (DUF2071 family)